MSPNRGLAVAFAAIAVVQTVGPIVILLIARAPIYRDVLHSAAFLCVMAAIAVTLYQLLLRRSFSIMALIAFYLGLAGLIAFDLWSIELTAASC